VFCPRIQKNEYRKGKLELGTETSTLQGRGDTDIQEGDRNPERNRFALKARNVYI
jgi:hypothetical protein